MGTRLHFFSVISVPLWLVGSFFSPHYPPSARQVQLAEGAPDGVEFLGKYAHLDHLKPPLGEKGIAGSKRERPVRPMAFASGNGFSKI
jgi:hypothetical protein